MSTLAIPILCLLFSTPLVASLSMPSWSSAASLLSSQQTPAEASFRARLAAGTAASPLASLRLFDGDAAPKVTFYRDSASWCPYSHGVWLQLEAKRISYQVEKVNMRCYGQKPASFQRLQPSGAIPVSARAKPAVLLHTLL